VILRVHRYQNQKGDDRLLPAAKVRHLE